MKVTIFGSDPALWIAFIGAVVTWLVSFELGWLNAGQATAIITFLTAVLIALTTKPMAPALFTGAIAAGAALFGEYGLHWSDAAVTGLGAVVLAGFALLGIRGQVTPNHDPKIIQGTVVAPVGPVK